MKLAILAVAATCALAQTSQDLVFDNHDDAPACAVDFVDGAPRTVIKYSSKNHVNGFKCSHSGSGLSTSCSCTSEHPAKKAGRCIQVTMPGAGGASLNIGGDCEAWGMESGIVTVHQSSGNDEDWFTVPFSQTYVNPVVIAGVPTRNGGDGIVVSVRNVNSAGFQVHLHESHCRGSEAHNPEEISWLVAEAGTHTLNGQTVVIGHHQNLAAETWESVAFPAGAFSAAPVVLTQIQDASEQDYFINTRMQSLSSTGFQVRTSKDSGSTHTIRGDETVGYVALPAGTGTKDGMMWFAASRTVQGTSTELIDFAGTTFPDASYAFFGGLTSFDDPAHSFLRIMTGNSDKTMSGVKVRIAEDNNCAAPGWTHGAETASFFAIQTGVVQDVAVEASRGFETGIATSDQMGVRRGGAGPDSWKSISFEQVYRNPVVVAGIPSKTGGHAIIVSVKDVTSTGFKFHLHETSCRDSGSDWHLNEQIAWMVAEAGTHTIGGKTFYAGIHKGLPANEWTTITAALTTEAHATFTSTPASVVSQIQDASTEDYFVNLRTRNSASPSFDVRTQGLSQQTGSGVARGDETVGYIMFEPGAGTSNGLEFLAGVTPDDMNHQFNAISLTPSFTHNGYGLFGSIHTFNGNNPVSLRYREGTKTASSVSIQLQEDRCDDNEVAHNGEEVSYFIAMPGILERANEY